MDFKAGIWASRLEFEPIGWDLGLKVGGGYEGGGEGGGAEISRKHRSLALSVPLPKNDTWNMRDLTPNL